MSSPKPTPPPYVFSCQSLYVLGKTNFFIMLILSFFKKINVRYFIYFIFFYFSVPAFLIMLIFLGCIIYRLIKWYIKNKNYQVDITKLLNKEYMASAA